MSDIKCKRIRIVDYQPLIYKLCWSFYESTGGVLEWADLVSECYLHWYKVRKKYNPKKGKFSTYIYTALRNHLITYTKEKLEERNLYSEDVIDVELFNDKVPDTESRLMFLDGIKQLSQDAKDVCKIIIDNPEKYCFITSSFKSRGNIRKQLKNMKWDYIRIGNAFSEIRTMLQTA